MGRLIRLAVVALVVYGCWQAASAQLDHFKLEDAVRQLAEFGADQGDDAVRTAVVAEATKLGIRIDPARVSIRKTADHIYIDVAYTRLVQVLPWYRYNWAFAVKVQSWYVSGARIR
ncbi:MAG: hypothetical protein NT151_01040 [Acidobacteria bacterium]|jgi:hypothetical protein|nr:hypothetical protein [Acidobacteriota bacterium]